MFSSCLTVSPFNLHYLCKASSSLTLQEKPQANCSSKLLKIVKYFNTILHLAFRCCFFTSTSLTSFILFVLVLSAHAHVCVLCLCVCVWYLTQMIIDKSPKYGCYFSLAPMVIWGILYSSPIYLYTVGYK